MPPRYSHSKSKRSVLDDSAYEESLNYVSEKAKRFASRIIEKHTLRDLGPSGVGGIPSLSGPSEGGLSVLPPQDLLSLSSAAVAKRNGGGADHASALGVAPSTATAAASLAIHDNIALFTEVASRKNSTNDACRNRSGSSVGPSATMAEVEPITPSHLLIKFIGYLPMRWLEMIVKAVETEHKRQRAIERERGLRSDGLLTSSDDTLSQLLSSDLLGGDDDEALLASPEEENYVLALEEEVRAILGLSTLGIRGDPKAKLQARRESSLQVQREAAILAVGALTSAGHNSSSFVDLSGTALSSIAVGGSPAAANVVGKHNTLSTHMSTLVRTVSSSATPLHVLDTFLCHKQQEARTRAVSTYSAIKAEHRRTMGILREQQIAINLNVKQIAEREQETKLEERRRQQQQLRVAGNRFNDESPNHDEQPYGGELLSEELIEECEKKRLHIELIGDVEERFKAAKLTAIIAHLVHKQANEAKAFLALLRLFHVLAEGGIAEEQGWRHEISETSNKVQAKRKGEQEAERSFMAKQNRTALSIRDLLRGGPSSAAATSGATANIVPHIPSSSSAFAAKWKLYFEQKKDNSIKTIIRDVIIPLLLGTDAGAVGGGSGTNSPRQTSNHKQFPSTYALLQSTALHMMFDMHPSMSDGRPATTTAMSVVSASNALYNNHNSVAHTRACNILGGIPTTNLLHLGLLLDLEQGSGPTTLTESGDEVRTAWWYVTPWTLQKRQEECLKLWQRFRPTSVSSFSPASVNNRSSYREDSFDAANDEDPNRDLLPTAADLFKRLYHSHKEPTSGAAIAQKALLGGGGGNSASGGVPSSSFLKGGFNTANALHALLLCEQWAGTVDNPDEFDEFIPNNVFPPIRPFLSFPYHVTVTMSEPAKVVLRNVLAPFVEEYWADVSTTTATSVLAAKDARDAEQYRENERNKIEADLLRNRGRGESEGSLFGPYYMMDASRNATPTKRDVIGDHTGYDDDNTNSEIDVASRQSSPSPRKKPRALTAKELEEKRRRTLVERQVKKREEEEMARQTAIERQRLFDEQRQDEANKEAIRQAKAANAVREQTKEKEMKLAVLNDPIVKARERLQQQIQAASALYNQHESTAPTTMPPREDSLATKRFAAQNADRSEDFAFVTNKIRRPLDQRAIEAKFLGGGGGTAMVASSSHTPRNSPRGARGALLGSSGQKMGTTYDPAAGINPQANTNEKGGDGDSKNKPHFVIVRRKIVVVRPKINGQEGEVEEVEEEIEEEVAEEPLLDIEDNAHDQREAGNNEPKVQSDSKSTAISTAQQKIVSNSIGFSYAPAAIESPLSPRSFPKHSFATDPYLSDAIASLDASAAAAQQVDAAEAVITRKAAHERAAAAYHENVMDKIVENRMNRKLEGRRAQRQKAMSDISEADEARKAGWSVAFIPHQDDSRVDGSGKFVARPMSEVAPDGYEHLSAHVSMARLYKNLGILELDEEPQPRRAGAIASILRHEQQESETTATSREGGGAAPLRKSRFVAVNATLQLQEESAKILEEKERSAKKVRSTIFTQIPDLQADSHSSGPAKIVESAASKFLQPMKVVVQDYNEALLNAIVARRNPREAAVNAPKITDDDDVSLNDGRKNRLKGNTTDAVVTVNKRRTMTAEKDVGLISFQPASALK